MQTLKEKVTAAVAMHLFAHTYALMPKDRTYKDGLMGWLQADEETQAEWRRNAAPVVETLESVAANEVEVGLERAAEALWRATAAGYAARHETWGGDVPEHVRESYRLQVRAVVNSWLKPGVLHG